MSKFIGIVLTGFIMTSCLSSTSYAFTSTYGNYSFYTSNGSKISDSNIGNKSLRNIWIQRKYDGSTGATWFYLDAYGSICTGWKQIDSKWYYFNESIEREFEGMMIQDCFIDDYYLGSDGAMKKGWFKTYDGYWYYANIYGHILKNTTIDGYKLDNKGRWT